MKRDTAAFALLLGLQAVGVFAFHVGFHEPWRDEAQHLLLAQRTHSLAELWAALRYEGHPFVLHYLFKGLLTFLSPPIALAAVGAIGYFVLSVATFFFLYYGGAAFPAAAAFAWILSLSYGTSYEMGVIARGYGLGMGLALAGAACLFRFQKNSSRSPLLWGSLSLALAMLTSIHSAIMAGCLALSFFVLACRERRPARAIAIALPSLVACCVLLLLVWELPDRRVSPVPVTLDSLGSRALAFGASLWNGTGFYAMAQTFNEIFFHYAFPTHWWNVAFSHLIKGMGLLFFWAALLLTAVHLIYRVFQNPKENRRLFLPFAAALLYFYLFEFFFRHLYSPSFRHQLFLSHGLFLALCLYWAREVPTGAVFWREVRSSQPSIRLPRQATLASWCLLGAITLFQVGAAALAFASDYFWYFSQTPIARAVIPDSENVTIVTPYDFPATPFAIWLPRVRLVSALGGGRAFTYAKWDQARYLHQISIQELIQRECEQTTADPLRRLYFAHTEPVSGDGFDLKEIFSADDSVPSSVPKERFRFYSIGCKPLAPGPETHRVAMKRIDPQPLLELRGGFEGVGEKAARPATE